MPLWWKVFVGLKARNTSWAQIWQSSKNIVCGFVAGNLAKSYEQLLEYEKVFMAIRSFKKNTTSLPRTSFFRAVFFAPYWGCNVLHDTFKRRTTSVDVWISNNRCCRIFVRTIMVPFISKIHSGCLCILRIPQPKNLKMFLSNSGYSSLCEASGGESDLCRCSQGWAYLRLQLQKNWNVWGPKRWFKS